MPRRLPKSPVQNSGKPSHGKISLKDLAAHLNLSPAAVSVVLNNKPISSTIPQETKDRIFNAARELNYRPNFFAQSFRTQRSLTIGILIPALTDDYSINILSGVESVLSKERFVCLTGSHHYSKELLEQQSKLLIERQVEGILAIDSHIDFPADLPIVSISGSTDISGITGIQFNYQKAAELGIEHLYNLGHRKIALIVGQESSSDRELRRSSIIISAAGRGVAIDPDLIIRLEGDLPSPEAGYAAANKILASRKSFTGIFAFNDISAIGAMSALRQSGRRIPDDVSVLGFDDVYAAAFQNPPLTTIRQPLFEIGALAARTLLGQLGIVCDQEFQAKTGIVSFEPELIVRQSTSKKTTRENDLLHIFA